MAEGDMGASEELIKGQGNLARALEARLAEHAKIEPGAAFARANFLPWQLIGDKGLLPYQIDELALRLSEAGATKSATDLTDRVHFIAQMASEFSDIEADELSNARLSLIERVRALTSEAAEKGANPEQLKALIKKEVETVNRVLKKIGKERAFTTQNFLRQMAIEAAKDVKSEVRNFHLNISAAAVQASQTHRELQQALSGVPNAAPIIAEAAPAQLINRDSKYINETIDALKAMSLIDAQAALRDTYVTKLEVMAAHEEKYTKAIRRLRITTNLEVKDILRATSEELQSYEVVMARASVAEASEKLIREANTVKPEAAALEFRKQYGAIVETRSTHEKALLNEHLELSKLTKNPKQADAYLAAIKKGEAIAHEGLEPAVLQRIQALKTHHEALEAAKLTEKTLAQTARSTLAADAKLLDEFEQHIHDLNEGLRGEINTLEATISPQIRALETEFETAKVALQGETGQRLGKLFTASHELHAGSAEFDAVLGRAQKLSYIPSTVKKPVRAGIKNIQEAQNLLGTIEEALKSGKITDANHTRILTELKDALEARIPLMQTVEGARTAALELHAADHIHVNAAQIDDIEKLGAALAGRNPEHVSATHGHVSGITHEKGSAQAAFTNINNMVDEIAEAAKKGGNAAKKGAETVKDASKGGGKGLLIAGGVAVVGAIAAVLAFNDKPRKSFAERIREQQAAAPNQLGA